MKNGDKIRVLQMEDHNGMDTQAIRMNGKTYTVDYLDDAGQVHLQESGLAVIPDVDRYVVIERGKEYSSIQEYDREILAIYDVITDYIRINEYVEEGDGLFLDKKNRVFLMPQRAIPRGREGTFFPMETMIRETAEGLFPDVDAIDDMVSRYVFVK